MRKIITTAAGELIDFDTVFEESLTLGDTPPADKVGRIEKVEYTTDVYEDGVTYPKYANVYLPYGYDENDTETRYNVLYLMHGHGGGYTTFFRGAGSFSVGFWKD